MKSKNKIFIDKIIEWANDYPSYLSSRGDYARGYKKGIFLAKDQVNEMITEYKEGYYFNDELSGADFDDDYHHMVDWCCGDNRYIIHHCIKERMEKAGYYFDIYCGNEYNEDGDCKEIYQYYIITERAAEAFGRFTNELVIYNEDFDIYLLCVTHWGTDWDYVSANWKKRIDD